MVLGFDESVAVLMKHLSSNKVAETEGVELLWAQGRVLAVAITADRDQPPFDRTTRDGFAVRAEEFSLGQTLRVVGRVQAGEAWPGPALSSGEAIEIMTGAPVPLGADAVAMVEHVERDAASVRAREGRHLRATENIVPRGAEARVGEVLVEPGRRVGAAEVALAAASGMARLTVYRRPRVAIVATGDELVEFGGAPEDHQIWNSNSYALAALVESAGGVARRLPIARDRKEDIKAKIDAARNADLLVLSGGVSMGEYDLVEEVLDSLGAEFFFTGVKMQPGKPVVFGRLPEKHGFPAQYFFGLPGNPISTQVTFHVFVEPMVRAMGGAASSANQFVPALLKEKVAGKTGLTRLLPGLLSGTEVRLVAWQGSGDLAANARANCYVFLPADREGFAAGEIVKVLLR